jgi:transposase
MAGKFRLPVLKLTVAEKARLDSLRRSRSEPVRKAERAKIPWHYHAGLNPTEIKATVNVSRVTVHHCLREALAMGLEAGLKDAFHRHKEPLIARADQAWVVPLACTKPNELGYVAELWTRRALAAQVRQHAADAAHPDLARAAQSTVQKLLAPEQLQPHKVKYYLEKRDPELATKMKEVLLVYQEVLVQNRAAEPAAASRGWWRCAGGHHCLD